VNHPPGQFPATQMLSRSTRRRRRARAVAAAAGRLASGLRVPALPTGFAGPAHAA
jgi:hypothetical protein